MPMEVRPTASSDLGAWLPGARVAGRWRLERPLKTSRVNELWSARGADGTRVALKTLRRDQSANAAARHALRHEFVLLRSFDHPHIVATYGYDDMPDGPALALEYLGGGDLTSLAGSPPDSWLGALSDLVATVAELNARGVVHRDLKARNVMFDTSNRVRLIDFASAARHGAVMGQAGTTAVHRRPGALRADPDDDLHALAVLVHELLTGRLPSSERPGNERVRGPLWDWAAAELASGARGASISELANVIKSELRSHSSQS